MYKPIKSTRKNKKYMVLVKGNRVIHFGDSRYEQFRDKLGLFSDLDHGDKKRRAAYYRRHGQTKNKDSAKWWSHHILW